MFKFQIRSFLLRNGFEETYKNCYEKDKVAFILEGFYLIVCKKNTRGYKIIRKFPLLKIHAMQRHNDGTIIV